MKKIILLFVLFIGANQLAKADEGLWLPLFLGQLNEAEMQAMGMEITAEDIYSVNHSSLKDAIVHFGGFCTAEVISNKGLLLTNHHCGYRAIQTHSTVENDLLTNGFWAMSNAEELRNKGLYAEFIRYMEDVTNDVLKGTTSEMSEEQIEQIVQKNIAEIIAAKKAESDHIIYIKPFYKGNQYFLFATEKYNDVRFVGAPPSSIGKYGADTDNWMWPRHTGDFSMFRIYASKDNLPAEISDDNVPYTPIKSLAISLKGTQAGDFTMVFGFPGTTDEYLPASAVEQILEVINPDRIEVRETLLAVLDKKMRVDAEAKLKYSAKYAGISNAYKKWIGQNIGLEETHALDKKRKHEVDFLSLIENDNELWGKYNTLFDEFNALYKEIEPSAIARNYFFEVGYSGIEAFKYSYKFMSFVNQYNTDPNSEQLDGMKARLEKSIAKFYKNYDADLDRQAFAALMPLYQNNVAQNMQPEVIYNVEDWQEKADKLYGKSIFTQTDSPEELSKLLEKDPKAIVKALEKDPIYIMMSDVYGFYGRVIQPQYNAIDDKIQAKLKTYMRLQMEVMKDFKFYPDANSTLRVTYGKVNGYSAKDAISYETHTYLEGVMEKYIPGDYEFDLPKKLIELYDTKDFGAYADGEKMPVCFIAANHTSGGNSGSPALNGKGELVGLNFDRAWEGTMSDINYDVSRCRNIMVDIRYVLFIVDKFAGAGYLVDEMEIVK